MADQELQQKNYIKLLGVSIDSSLNFMNIIIFLTFVAKLVDKSMFSVVSSVLFLLMLNSSYIIHLFFLILIIVQLYGTFV